jgi:ubiquinone/menaquinone biosynthesis C-methylase UbiE
MINTTFSKEKQGSVKEPYIATKGISERIVQGNNEMDTGTEHRLQRTFGDENWLKLARAGFTPDEMSGENALEVCAGTDFLTCQLLNRCQSKWLTVNDISATELSAARNLSTGPYLAAQVDWALGNMHMLDLGRRFDVIIGNSFIHHFHDVPRVLSRLSSMLNPGGVFISLHEPKPMSAVVEGGA